VLVELTAKCQSKPFKKEEVWLPDENDRNRLNPQRNFADEGGKTPMYQKNLQSPYAAHGLNSPGFGEALSPGWGMNSPSYDNSMR